MRVVFLLGLLAATSLGMTFSGAWNLGSTVEIFLPLFFLALATFAGWYDHIPWSDRLGNANCGIAVAWAFALLGPLFWGGSYLFRGSDLNPLVVWPVLMFGFFTAGALIARAYAHLREVKADIEHADKIQKLHDAYRKQAEYGQSEIENLKRQLKYEEERREADRRAVLYAGDQARIAPSSSSSHSRRY